MKLIPALPTLWASLLVLCVSQSVTEDNSLDECLEDMDPCTVQVQNSMELDDHKDKKYVGEKFTCLLHPTNLLNCSWSLHKLEKDFQLSVHMSICDDDIKFESLNHTFMEGDGSMSLNISDYKRLFVILHLNMSWHDGWKTYTEKYNKYLIEGLSPPQNISASIKDGVLKVTWDEPHSRFGGSAFDYQLEIDDQGTNKIINTAEPYYTDPKADPSHTYKVRIRTRRSDSCQPFSSDWSRTVMFAAVEPSAYKLNPVVILSISLGIPMILLAVLLFVRYQRVSEVLFPPIPRPPPKYKYFLEKHDAFSFFHPAPPAKPEEEITEVEETEPNT